MSTPNFIIAGERRSGTSTLAKWIEVHPEIYLYPEVDKAFFVDDILRGRRDWMEGTINPTVWKEENSKADYLKLFEKADNSKLAIGEKSADYFFWNPCEERIRTCFPDMKIVLTFRHPVDRAWSHYWNEVGKGREKKSFEEALLFESYLSEQSDYAKLHLSYFERGKYVESLKRWLKFWPMEQIHVVILENLISNPKDELEKLYRYLGVAPDLGYDRVGIRFNNNWTTTPYSWWKSHPTLESVEMQINNLVKKFVKYKYPDPYERRRQLPRFEKITRKTQSQFKMSDQTRSFLLKRFRPYTEELESVLNISLEKWKK